ncbi:MAG TPA: hypothetical protein VH370_02570 [Humisphaera sp.]|nr:hypothetical protein [Humisphaera sp.]
MAGLINQLKSAAAMEIHGDLPCVDCRYNLRGLQTDGNCPECGTAIEKALGRSRLNGNGSLLTAVRRTRFYPVMAVSGCPIDGVLFVHDSMRTAVRRKIQEVGQGKSIREAGKGRSVHVSAADICEGFRVHAKHYFNDQSEAMDLLNEWGLRSSEDVGRVIFAMVAVGALVVTEQDSIEHFSGLFTLDSLLKVWEYSR